MIFKDIYKQRTKMSPNSLYMLLIYLRVVPFLV